MRRRDAPARALRLCSLLVAAVALAAPASAGAHAELERTEPRPGAALERSPGLVELYFSGAIEPRFADVRIVDDSGERVDEGELVQPGEGGESIAARLPADLAGGAYVVAYRIVSADSHPIAGTFTFEIAGALGPAAGRAGRGDGGVDRAAGDEAATVRDPAPRIDAEEGSATAVALGVARFAGSVAIAVALGALVFAWAVLRPAVLSLADAEPGWALSAERFAGALRLLVIAAVALGIASSVAALALHGATVAGGPLRSALEPGVVIDGLDTRLGATWGLRVVAWLALGAALTALPLRTVAPRLRVAELGATGLVGERGPSHARLAAVGVLLAVLVLAPALGGHAATREPTAVLLPAHVLHVLAVGAWIGGLACILAALPGAVATLQPSGRSRLLAAALARFSPLALACVAAIAATGTIQSIVHLRELADLAATPYGRAIAVKAVLLAGLIALGAVNRRHVMPRLGALARAGEVPGGAGRLLGRTVAAEAALAGLVLAVAAVLSGHAPPSAL